MEKSSCQVYLKASSYENPFIFFKLFFFTACLGKKTHLVQFIKRFSSRGSFLGLFLCSSWQETACGASSGIPPWSTLLR